MKLNKGTISLSLLLLLLSSDQLFAENQLNNSQGNNVQLSNEITETNAQVQQALMQGRPLPAYEQLLLAYRGNRYDNQTLFFLGITAKQLEKYDESEKYLRELMNKDPNAPRVKLELAEVVYRNGNSKEAKQLLLEVKAANPPERVGKNVDDFIAFIENGEPKAVNASISLGLLYDTNANQGPTTDTILLYGLPFTLSSDAKPAKDWATTFKADVNYTKALIGATYLQAELSVNAQNYFELNTFDYSSLAFSVGPSLRKKNWIFSAPYIFNILRFGHDQDYYYYINGLAPQFGYQISKNIMLSGSVTFASKNFLTDIGRNSEVFGVSPSVRYSLGKTSSLTLGGYSGRENADIETYSNDSWGINGVFYHSFSKHWSASISPSYLKTTYKGEEMLFGTNRKDEYISMNTALNYLIEPLAANLSLSYTWSKNTSMIDLYQYDRQQVMLSISKNF